MGAREISISRELTKKYEEHINNNIDNVIDSFNKEKFLEITIVIKGLEKGKAPETESSHLKDLHELISAGLSLQPLQISSKKNNMTKRVYIIYIKVILSLKIDAIAI